MTRSLYPLIWIPPLPPEAIYASAPPQSILWHEPQPEPPVVVPPRPVVVRIWFHGKLVIPGTLHAQALRANLLGAPSWPEIRRQRRSRRRFLRKLVRRASPPHHRRSHIET